MDPGVMKLAVIGCVVLMVLLELVAIALFLVIGFRNGFVRKSYVNEISGERVESTLPWLLYVQIVPALPVVVLALVALFKTLDAIHAALGTGGVVLIIVGIGVVAIGVFAFRRLNRAEVTVEDITPRSPATPVRPLGALQPAPQPVAHVGQPVGWGLDQLPPEVAAQPWSGSYRRPGE